MDSKSPEAFRTISEVAEWLGVPTHVLRFWESRFAQVKPVKRAGGRRYYRPSDMELLGGIRQLLHDDGMTIRGVQKLLREKGVKHVASLSPSIDQPADLQNVGGSKVVDLAERREGGREAPVFAADIEDAELVEGPSEAEEAAAAAEDAGAAAPADVQASLFDNDAPDMAEADAPSLPDAWDAFEAEDAPAEDMADVAAPADEAAAPEVDLDGPEAMEFFAHEAPPETAETDPDTGADMFDSGTDERPAEDVAADVEGAMFDEAEDAVGTAQDDPFAMAPMPTAPQDGPGTDAAAALFDDDAGSAVVTEDGALDPATSAAPEAVEPPAEIGIDEASTGGLEAAAEDETEDGAKDSDSTSLFEWEEVHPAEEPGRPDNEISVEATPGPAASDALEPAEDADSGGARPEAVIADEALDAAAEPSAPISAAEADPDATEDDPAEPAAAPTEDAAAEQAPTLPEAAPVAAAAPVAERGLVMPDLAPDPEDEAAFGDILLVAQRLRAVRASAAAGSVPAARLQAYADRLQALSGRLGRSPDTRRPF